MADILETLAELEDDDFAEDFDTDETTSLAVIEEDDGVMSPARAQEITEAIRSAATVTYILLAQAHEKQAHKAMGYDTWSEYVKAEFEMSAQRSYQLLDLAKVVSELETVTPEGTDVKLTEAQARDIKRELPKVTEKIREAIEGGETPEAAVDRAIEEVRDQKKADDKAVAAKQAAAEDADDEARRATLEAGADTILEENGYKADGSSSDETEDGGLSPEDSMNLYNFFNVLSGVTSLPEPDDFIKTIPKARAEEVANQLEEAVQWINRFQSLFEAFTDE